MCIRDSYPAEEISLRSATAQNFVVLNVSKNNALLAEVDYDSAPFLIHESAIYIHQSQTFYIDRLDWERRTAYAREVEVDYYTDAQSKTDVRVLTEDAVSCINLPPPCLLYTSPSPRDRTRSRMPSSA